MIATLVQIDAWAGPTATLLRFASHDDERLCHLDGQVWWPAIAQLPTLRRDLFDGSFDAGSITTPSGDLTLCIDAVPGLPALALHDTRVRIWRGTLGVGFDLFGLVFDGRVKEQPAIKDGLARLSIVVDDSWLDQPLLATYAGTGGAEGPAAMQGQVKPLALGAPRFAPATLIDAIDNIYQISAYGPMQAVETAFERLNRFGVATGDAGNFASLKAADIAAGRWATCLAGGYVRFGAPAEGLLSFHVQGDAQGGWSRLPGDIIARIATIAGGAGRFAAGDVAALNIARPWPLSIMITDQTTARDLIQRIAASVNAVAYVDWSGVLRIAPVGIGTASLTMAADGSALPPVASIGQIAIAAPYWKIAQGAATTWQVHALSDIAFTATLNPRGPYDNAESYREGDIVTLANGSQWLFVGVTPLVGSAPDDANGNWFRLSGDITAGNITYEDGTPVEDLKPAEPGANNGAPPGSPVGDEEAQAVIDSMRVGLATTALEAIRNGSFRIEQEERQEDFIRVLDQVGVVVNGHAVYISFLREVDSGGNAQWAITAENSTGAITGIRNLLTGDGIGRLLMAADILQIIDPNGGAPIRVLDYGLDNILRLQNVTIEGDLVVIGSITTERVAANAISAGDTASLASPIAGNGAWHDAVTYNLTIPISDPPVDWQAIAIVTGSQSFPSGDRDWDARLKADGVQIAAAGGQKSEDSFALSGRAIWGAGAHSFTLEWNGQSGASLVEANMVILWLKR